MVTRLRMRLARFLRTSRRSRDAHVALDWLGMARSVPYGPSRGGETECIVTLGISGASSQQTKQQNKIHTFRKDAASAQTALTRARGLHANLNAKMRGAFNFFKAYARVWKAGNEWTCIRHGELSEAWGSFIPFSFPHFESLSFPTLHFVPNFGFSSSLTVVSLPLFPSLPN